MRLIKFFVGIPLLSFLISFSLFSPSEASPHQGICDDTTRALKTYVFGSRRIREDFPKNLLKNKRPIQFVQTISMGATAEQILLRNYEVLVDIERWHFARAKRVSEKKINAAFNLARLLVEKGFYPAAHASNSQATLDSYRNEVIFKLRTVLNCSERLKIQYHTLIWLAVLHMDGRDKKIWGPDYAHIPLENSWDFLEQAHALKKRDDDLSKTIYLWKAYILAKKRLRPLDIPAGSDSETHHKTQATEWFNLYRTKVSRSERTSSSTKPNRVSSNESEIISCNIHHTNKDMEKELEHALERWNPQPSLETSSTNLTDTNSPSGGAFNQQSPCGTSAPTQLSPSAYTKDDDQFQDGSPDGDQPQDNPQQSSEPMVTTEDQSTAPELSPSPDMNVSISTTINEELPLSSCKPKPQKRKHQSRVIASDEEDSEGEEDFEDKSDEEDSAPKRRKRNGEYLSDHDKLILQTHKLQSTDRKLTLQQAIDLLPTTTTNPAYRQAVYHFLKKNKILQRSHIPQLEDWMKLILDEAFATNPSINPREAMQQLNREDQISESKQNDPKFSKAISEYFFKLRKKDNQPKQRQGLTTEQKKDLEQLISSKSDFLKPNEVFDELNKLNSPRFPKTDKSRLLQCIKRYLYKDNRLQPTTENPLNLHIDKYLEEDPSILHEEIMRKLVEDKCLSNSESLKQENRTHVTKRLSHLKKKKKLYKAPHNTLKTPRKVKSNVIAGLSTPQLTM